MSKKTKKLGISAKFGARYGVSVKSQINAVEAKTKEKYHCPKCNYKSVRRVGSGIWECRRCGLKFTGGAYTPVTQIVEEVTPNV
ncbi:MAG: 50S ribosomal protein L37ae [Thermoplasmatales archaeon]|nr:50S ribosomal protein L37ae [Thermoplasmatales archaeon]